MSNYYHIATLYHEKHGIEARVFTDSRKADRWILERMRELMAEWSDGRCVCEYDTWKEQMDGLEDFGFVWDVFMQEVGK